MIHEHRPTRRFGWSCRKCRGKGRREALLAVSLLASAGLLLKAFALPHLLALGVLP